ncbi:hypothetical protein M407DRAFT_101705 [Tulasnella calospora MUT 4182]|uniref:Uncharacterized protein n=1 Tax=Tulasnella calospora MUT 4182 TaxID=1051891 RepID=A0A0C3QG51_9AGAM|nr:hypothetical protein M407DRAFT_101705 [Tulasnella calospora MUT 4182]
MEETPARSRWGPSRETKSFHDRPAYRRRRGEGFRECGGVQRAKIEWKGGGWGVPFFFYGGGRNRFTEELALPTSSRTRRNC